MNAIVRTVRNLVANSIVADCSPSGQHVGQHLRNAACQSDQGDPIDVAMVAWEHIAPLVDADVTWIDHPGWPEWTAIVDAAKTYLASVGYLEFAHTADGNPSVQTRIVDPAEVRVNAWIRRVRGSCARNLSGSMILTYRTTDDWGPAFHQVASVRSTFPASVLADALDGREPTSADRQFLFVGVDGRPLVGFTYPVPADMPIEMIA